jgi:hypothetical protein
MPVGKLALSAAIRLRWLLRLALLRVPAKIPSLGKRVSAGFFLRGAKPWRWRRE